MNDPFSTIASLATSVGVLLAAWQLWLTRRQSVTDFEDTFSREYRTLAMTIPTKAFLGENLSESEFSDSLNDFYHYFDLCNQQIFLKDAGRVTGKTWTYWREGILSNMNRPAFRQAWNDIALRSSPDFSELRRLCPPSPVGSPEGRTSLT